MKFSRSRRVFYLLTLLVLPMLSFGDGQVGALFAKGNALYAKAQYKDALTAYQQIIDGGYQSAAVYFNMGNASYKNGDIPSAVLYYEKAHRLAPGDDDINFNISYVDQKTPDKIDDVPEFFLIRWWKVFILSFSTTVLAIWSNVFVVLGSGILVLYFFANAVLIKKASFYISIILFFLGISTILMANCQVSYFDGHHQAIVFSGSINVKSGPVETSNTLFVIHDGAKVNILDTSNGWMKISLANGNVGWLKEGDVKEI